MNAMVDIPGIRLAKPMLMDYAIVCHQLPEDQRRQWVALGSGQPFDSEEMALQLASRSDPAWTGIGLDGKPIFVGGFSYIRPGVWQDWLITTPEAWTDHWRAVSKVCRRMVDAMLEDAHRIQCVALADRTRAHEWYRVLKYEFEGVLHGYGAEGQDAVMYARVKNHG